MNKLCDTPEKILERIKTELDEVPSSPGCYLWKDEEGRVIYVGKAKQLRARMRQYVNFADDRAKIPLLVAQIRSFDYIVTANEHESLVLEKNLIKQYTPFFNADFKDDKSYPFIALVKSCPFPALKYTREKHKADTEYFGPYTDSRAARRMVDIVRRVVPVCTSTCVEWRHMNRQLKTQSYEEYLHANPKECFDAHLGLGPGACCGKVSPDEYKHLLKKVRTFLNGYHAEFLEELRSDMREAAAELDFEQAARIKDRIDIIESLATQQVAVAKHTLDADVVGFHREEGIAGVQILVIREGRIVNANEFILTVGLDVPEADLTYNFLTKYFDTGATIPKELIVSCLFDEYESMEALLSEKREAMQAVKHGAKVRFSRPQKGEKLKLLQMAQLNAKHALMRYKVRNNYDDKRINEALLQLESALALDTAPLRIESYDISTIHGSYTVASMVVFTNGKPDKSQYRRFKIKTELDEANDFLCMQEVLTRRFSEHNKTDKRFASRPDLIILDGGKPQLNAVVAIAEEIGFTDVSLCGLAKRYEENFFTWNEDGPLILPSGSASLYLVKQIRDEAHRFAIEFHRLLRKKGMTKSILDEVSGLGPKRKKALLKHFKSFGNLKVASLEEIEASNTVPKEIAHEVYEVLRQYGKDSE